MFLGRFLIIVAVIAYIYVCFCLIPKLFRMVKGQSAAEKIENVKQDAIIAKRFQKLKKQLRKGK